MMVILISIFIKFYDSYGKVSVLIFRIIIVDDAKRT